MIHQISVDVLPKNCPLSNVKKKICMFVKCQEFKLKYLSCNILSEIVLKIGQSIVAEIRLRNDPKRKSVLSADSPPIKWHWVPHISRTQHTASKFFQTPKQGKGSKELLEMYCSGSKIWSKWLEISTRPHHRYNKWFML